MTNLIIYLYALLLFFTVIAVYLIRPEIINIPLQKRKIEKANAELEKKIKNDLTRNNKIQKDIQLREEKVATAEAQLAHKTQELAAEKEKLCKEIAAEHKTNQEIHERNLRDIEYQNKYREDEITRRVFDEKNRCFAGWKADYEKMESNAISAYNKLLHEIQNLEHIKQKLVVQNAELKINVEHSQAEMAKLKQQHDVISQNLHILQDGLMTPILGALQKNNHSHETILHNIICQMLLMMQRNQHFNSEVFLKALTQITESSQNNSQSMVELSEAFLTALNKKDKDSCMRLQYLSNQVANNNLAFLSKLGDAQDSSHRLMLQVLGMPKPDSDRPTINETRVTHYHHTHVDEVNEHFGDIQNNNTTNFVQNRHLTINRLDQSLAESDDATQSPVAIIQEEDQPGSKAICLARPN